MHPKTAQHTPPHDESMTTHSIQLYTDVNNKTLHVSGTTRQCSCSCRASFVPRAQFAPTATVPNIATSFVLGTYDDAGASNERLRLSHCTKKWLQQAQGAGHFKGAGSACVAGTHDPGADEDGDISADELVPEWCGPLADKENKTLIVRVETAFGREVLNVTNVKSVAQQRYVRRPDGIGTGCPLVR